MCIIKDKSLFLNVADLLLHKVLTLIHELSVMSLSPRPLQQILSFINLYRIILYSFFSPVPSKSQGTTPSSLLSIIFWVDPYLFYSQKRLPPILSTCSKDPQQCFTALVVFKNPGSLQFLKANWILEIFNLTKVYFEDNQQITFHIWYYWNILNLQLFQNILRTKLSWA